MAGHKKVDKWCRHAGNICFTEKLADHLFNKNMMRITSLQSFMTKCSCNIFIFTHYRYVKIQKRRREELEKDGIDSAQWAPLYIVQGSLAP